MRPTFSPVLASSVLIGLGLGLQASALFALSARVGLGTPLDARVFGTVFGALVAVSTWLFRRSLRTVPEAGTGRAIAIASIVAAALCALGLTAVAALTSPLGFKEHAIRFGEDASLAGTPRLDALSALVMLVLPSLGIGAAAAAQRNRPSFVAALIGFAAGWVLRAPLVDLVGNSSPLAVRGAAAVCAGVLVLWWRQSCRPRWIGGLGAAVGAAAMLVPVTPIVVYPPWQRFPVQPLDIYDTPHGQITIQPAGGRTLQVLLNQRPVTPMAKEVGLERACLRRTIELWRTSGRSKAPRTLVLGVMTPQRRALLAQAGITEFYVDHRLRARSARIHENLGIETPAPAFDGQDIDLVFSFPIGAYVAAGWTLALARNVDAPLKTLWLPPDMDVQVQIDGARLALASDGVERFAFGLALGGGPGVATATYPLGEARRTSVGWMSTRPDRRPNRTLRHVTQRLGTQRLSTGTDSAFARGLAAHAANQRLSSPFESPLEAVELSGEALDLWRDAMLARSDPPSSFERGVIEGAAAALRAQGDVERVVAFVSPLAATYPGAIRLEAAVAWADLEAFRFRAAAGRLRPFLAEDLDGAGAADRDVARLLANALVALGDPEGRGIANRLLRNAPQDPELFGLARGMRGMNTMGPTLGGYESLSIDEARASMAGAVLGTVTGGQVKEVDPGDGAPLYVTELEIFGTLIATSDGQPTTGEGSRTHRILFLGGFRGPDRGSFNSTAPPTHMVRKDRRVLAFYESERMIAPGATGLPLLRGRAGIFTAFENGDGHLVIQGRGSGSAIPMNTLESDLPTLLSE